MRVKHNDEIRNDLLTNEFWRKIWTGDGKFNYPPSPTHEFRNGQ